MATVTLLVTPLPVDSPHSDFESTWREIGPGEAALAVNDFAPHRGDGVFETMAIIDGHVQEVDPHLARLQNSARLTELPEPNLDQWRAAIAVAASKVPATGEYALKLALSRGLDPGDAPSGWIHVTPGADFTSQREQGIRVALLDRGLPLGIGERAPWLLVGAKTLSYAGNMAAIREAKSRGAHDAVYVTSDGWVLEGPTSSLIVRSGDTFFTPPPTAGILHGTTQRSLFAHLDATGRLGEYRDLTVDDVKHADAAWLVSSVRMACGIVAVDDVELPFDAEMSADFNQYLLSPRE